MLGAVLMLSACASANYSNLPPLPTTVAPDAPVAEGLPPYRVQIGDVLDLKFYLNPEFDETVTVRPDGMISTKVVDNMMVYNQTISDINSELKKFYKSELKNPRLTTVVRSFAPIKIYVSGEVVSPGEFVVVGQPLTLTQAIARAGGIKNSGKANQVLVIRRGAGEKGQVYVADYNAATQGGDPASDARLAPYDVVFVPKAGPALVYKEYQQYLQQFINPGLGVNYSLNNN
jgi:polysaccharide export outer membrane protein